MMEKWLKNLSHQRAILTLVITSYFLLMFGNNLVSLTHPDEVFYTQTVKEMINHQSWMTPMIFDQPQFEKPIFTYWLMIISVKIFGLTPFAARFTPALFGILGVLATYWLAWILFRKKETAFLAGFILSTGFIYLALSRAVLTDMVFSVLVAISLAFFLYGYKITSRKNLGIIFCFIFSALAVLAKGLLGIVFPGIIIIVFLLVQRNIKFLLSYSTLIGIALFTMIALPWHILMYQLYGSEFIQEYFYNVHIRRIFDAEHPRCDTWYFYIGTMFGGMFPWSLYLFAAFWLGVRKLKKDQEGTEAIRFLFIWILSVLFIVQVAKSKLASYIFPVFPPIAIILSYYFNLVFEKKVSLAPVRICGYIMSILFFIASIAVIFVGRRYVDFIGDFTIVYLFSFFAFLASLMIFQTNRLLRYNTMVFSHGLITGIVLIVLFLGRDNAEPWVSCKNVIDVFKTIDHTKSTILTSKFYVRGVRYYTDRPTAVIDINGKGFFSPHPIPFLNTDAKVLELLNSQPVTYGVLKEGNVKDMERIIQGKFRLVHHYDTGGKYIVHIEKL